MDEGTSQRGTRQRTLGPLEDKQYDTLISICDGSLHYKRGDRTGIIKTLYDKKYTWQLSCRTVSDRLNPEGITRLVYTLNDTEMLVLRTSEVGPLIDDYYREHKGMGAAKLAFTMKMIYSGIGEKLVQAHLNKISAHHSKHPSFGRKAPLLTIQANKPMERFQFDLVDYSKKKATQNGISYAYVLSILDVFSRHLWLYPIPNKTQETVTLCVHNHFLDWGTCTVAQCDRGTEFGKIFELVLSQHGIRTIHSRAHHPQSQGKIERSHKTWKEYLRFDEEHEEDVNWVDRIKIYQRNYNESLHSSLGVCPYEAMFGIQPNRLCRVPSIDSAEVDGYTVETALPSEEHPTCGQDSSLKKDNIRREVKEHLSVLDMLRDKTLKSSRSASDKMIQRHAAKHPPPVYVEGEEVLVKVKSKDERVQTKRPNITKGTITSVHANSQLYRVDIRTLEGKKKSKLLPTENICLLTRGDQGDREKENQADKVPKLCSCQENNSCSLCKGNKCKKIAAAKCVQQMHWTCCKSTTVQCDLQSHNNARSKWEASSTKTPDVHAKESTKDLTVRRTGVRNIAQNCWLSASLQALESIISGESLATIGKSASNGVVEEIARTMSKLTQSKTVVDPTDLLMILKDTPFIPGRYGIQQDAHEFLTKFLTEIISMDIFEGIKMMWHQRCLGCEHSTTSASVEEACLEIDIIQDDVQLTSVQECVDNCLRFWDVVVEEESPFCSECKERVGMARQLSINNCPPTIIIHLKRYGPELLKNSAPVELNRKIQVNSSSYALKSVVLHEGGSRESGHYVTLIVEEGVICNDHAVSSAKQDVLKSKWAERNSYVLMFKKITERPSLCVDHSYCMGYATSPAVNDMPNEILFDILMDVVLSCGDKAYQLSAVCSRWNDVLKDPEFKLKHHLSWIESLGLPVEEQEKKEYSRMFSIEHCSFCGKQFKQQQIGWQGDGQVGVATGWKEEIDHPGACCHAHLFD